MSSLKKDYFWNTLGVLLQNVISPVLLLVVTRVNGIEAAGLFSFAFSVSLLLYALAMWGGRTYQVSDVITKEFKTGSYIMVRVLLAVLVVFVSIVFCVINGYDAYKTNVILALVLFKLIESFSDVLYGVLQVNGKLYLSGRSLAIKSLFGMVFFVLLDILTGNILLSIYGVVVVNLLVFLSFDLIMTRRSERIRFSAQRLREYTKEAFQILRRCVSVFAVMFLAMFSLNVPRYFIDSYSVKEVGYFGIMAMPITLIVLLITFVLQPNVVALSELYSSKKMKQFGRSVGRILLLSIGIGIVVLIGTALVGSWALGLIFGVNFDDYALALDVIVAGGVASALVTVYLNIFVIVRRVNIPLIVLIITDLLLIPISYYAVDGFGLMGGVIAFSVVSAVQFVLLWLYFRFILQGEKV